MQCDVTEHKPIIHQDSKVMWIYLGRDKTPLHTAKERLGVDVSGIFPWTVPLQTASMAMQSLNPGQ